MRIAAIKGADFKNREQIHEYLAGILEFPPYYGKNLSALYDVLTETDLKTQIRIDYENMLDQEMIEYLDRMVQVITDAAAGNPDLELIVNRA
ncbi:MAG: barstar family protein [Blautia sp.]|nr:barstar family protein [Blautia sp.]